MGPQVMEVPVVEGVSEGVRSMRVAALPYTITPLPHTTNSGFPPLHVELLVFTSDAPPSWPTSLNFIGSQSPRSMVNSALFPHKRVKTRTRRGEFRLAQEG